MKNSVYIALIMLLYPVWLSAQEENDTVNTVVSDSIMLLSDISVPGLPYMSPEVPPSPQAVAFTRLGDYKVNNNYGAPDISIPLYEIDFHGYRIPLTLHYEAAPLKSGYNYDVTGLGWTLSGNSCVSRTINDCADEYSMFGTQFVLDSFQDHSGHPRRYMDYANDLDRLNFQYDNYNIVLPSGRTIPFFMYKENGIMKYDLMSSDCHVKISCSYGQNSIDAFTLKDENGITYHFTVADKIVNGLESDFNANRNVTWLLTSIDIPAKGTINYEYMPLKNIHTQTVSEPLIRVSRLFSGMSEDAQEKRINVMKILQSQSPRYSMRFLSRICYGPTKIDFNYTSDGEHMTDIVVSDCGETIRTFTLGINGSSLTSLVISGQNEEDKLVYGFTYTNKIPGNYTDYWGNLCESNRNTYDLGNFNMYINKSEINRTSLEKQLSAYGNPAQVIDNNPDDLNYYLKIKLQTIKDGESRQPTSPQFHGVLSSITYPNGGRTTFTFENHRFLTASSANGDIVFDRRSQRIIEGGGFRIESIINWTADGEIASKDYYRYGFTYNDIKQKNFPLPLPEEYNIKDHIGCGEAVVDPNLLTFMNYSYSSNVPSGFREMAVGLPSNFKNMYNIQGTPMWWDAFFSANTFRTRLHGRRPVVYPEITVYHGNPHEPTECIGKTVYKYDIYSYQLDPIISYMSYFKQTAVPDTAYFEPLYYYMGGPGLVCLESPDKRHQLKYMSDYSYNNGTWNLVSEEKYSYSEDNLYKSGYIFDSAASRGHCGRHTIQLGMGCRLEYIDLSGFYKPIMKRLGTSKMTGKSTTILRHGGTRSKDNTQTEEYSYLYSGVLKKKSYTDVYDNEDMYSYVGEEKKDSDTVISAMRSRNMLASVITAETTSLHLPEVISGQKIDYAFYGNNILPSRLYELNGDVYKESIEVLSYDSYGNPTEIMDSKTGIHSVFLWDSYGRYMTAMIQDATLSQVQGASSQLSEGDSRSRHTALQTLLPNARIQTWDYMPLIGVSSHTDINGKTILYEYDGLGRLKTEKRIVNGFSKPETIHEYEYHFSNGQQ